MDVWRGCQLAMKNKINKKAVYKRLSVVGDDS